ncbi:MAG: GlxA family transcriptional regulator [Ginsengibacter sp.]
MDENLRRVIFFVPPGVHLMDLTGPAHVFYELSTFDCAYEILYCSILDEITSSAHLSLNNFMNFRKIETRSTDIIFIPGGDFNIMMTDEFRKSLQPFNEWLEQSYLRNAKIASVCTGAFILGIAGVIYNKMVTTHWKYLNKLQDLYPDTIVNKNVLFVKDGNLYSSAGVCTGIDLALYLVEEIHGIKMANDVSKEMVVYIRRKADNPQESIYLQHRNHIESDIHKVQDYIITNLNQKLRLSELAAIVFMSERNFTRLFKKTIGITALTYINEMKKERAVTLMNNSDMSVRRVAFECGLRSANQLRNIIKK